MNELIEWLNANKIQHKPIDSEVMEIPEFGRMLVADLSGVTSIFRGEGERQEFNLMESPEVLIEEGICFVAFPFGSNWYYYDLREEFRFNILKYIGQRQECVNKTPFVNLGIHTPYELLSGSGDLSLWVKKTKYLGHTAIGICDENTMAATLNLQKECVKAGIKHVFGYSLTLEHNGEKVAMKLYCLTQQGLRNMLRIQKAIMVDSNTKTLSLAALLAHSEGIALVFGKLSAFWMTQNQVVVEKLRKAFPKLYFQVDLTEYKAERIDSEVLHSALHYFTNFYDAATDSFSVEPILICDNYYLDRDDARNKILLEKIASGAAHRQSDEQYFKDVDEHFAVFKQLFDADKWNVSALFERMCQATVEIAQCADAKYEKGKMYMPQYIMLDEEVKKYGNRHRMFLSLLEEGLQDKASPQEHARYRERLCEEAYIVESTNNVDYFLVQWDMVREACRRGIVTGIGRGSAGGSLVSFLLGITTIDPIKYDLLFSRFLVPERCGLEWVDKITIVGKALEVPAGKRYVEICADDTTYKIDTDAKLLVIRNEQQMEVYADELKEGDEILFDRRDLLWTLNNPNQCLPQ